jgi:hypothetical protein
MSFRVQAFRIFFLKLKPISHLRPSARTGISPSARAGAEREYQFKSWGELFEIERTFRVCRRLSTIC